MLFSMKAATYYLFIFAFVIGLATFIENDFGTSAAQKVIFRARWFEVLLLFICIALVVNIVKYRMIENKKWAVLTFHISIIVILIGSAITRYTGYEGMMHIREGASSNTFLSSETSLLFEVIKEDKVYRFDEEVLFSSLGSNRYSGRYRLDDDLLGFDVKRVIPNPKKIASSTSEGKPTLKIVIGGSAGREEYFIQEGEQLNIRGQLFNFSEERVAGVTNIRLNDGQLEIMSPSDYTVMQMATQTRDTFAADSFQRLRLRSLYSNSEGNFVFGEYLENAGVEIVSDGAKLTSESSIGIIMDLVLNDETEEVFIKGQKGVQAGYRYANMGDLKIGVTYGTKAIELPFSLFLDDFILERYPGTNSASSYESKVTLVDERFGLRENHRIYMNNILNYGGYRFFQSSYDPDELGTYLSVNHDFWGTWVSYLGYFLLTIGMILTFFSPSSRYNYLSRQVKNLKSRALTITLLVLSFGAFNPVIGQTNDILPVPADHAALFSTVIVQDHRGRFKPMHTLSSEIIRKISRKSEHFGQNAQQLFLGMVLVPDLYLDKPLIKLGHHQKIAEILDQHGPLASYEDFFNESGQYILKDEVRQAHGKNRQKEGYMKKSLSK